MEDRNNIYWPARKTRYDYSLLRPKEDFNGLNDVTKAYDSKYSLFMAMAIPEIKKVIFNEPATIVYWSDNTKTVVKANEESFDKEKGLAMAMAKKIFGDNKGIYYKEFKKWCK